MSEGAGDWQIGAVTSTSTAAHRIAANIADRSQERRFPHIIGRAIGRSTSCQEFAYMRTLDFVFTFSWILGIVTGKR